MLVLMKLMLILFLLLFLSSCTTSSEIVEKNVKFLKVRAKCLFDGFERDTFKYKTCIKKNMAK